MDLTGIDAFVGDFFTCFFQLFLVIDIVGNIPVIIKIKQDTKGFISPQRTSLSTGIILFGFLFVGKYILAWYEIEVAIFSMAGGILLLVFALEMLLNVQIVRKEEVGGNSASIIPVSFPLISGPGALTLLLNLGDKHDLYALCLALFCNIVIIYVVLSYLYWIQNKLGKLGFLVLKKFVGLMLLAIALQIFKNNIFYLFGSFLSTANLTFISSSL